MKSGFFKKGTSQVYLGEEILKELNCTSYLLKHQSLHNKTNAYTYIKLPIIILRYVL